MNQQAAIDSNVLVALVDEQDKWHAQANELLDAIREKGIDVIYFDCVLNETVSVMARRSEEQKRSAQFPALLDELGKRVPEELITWISGETQHWYGRIIALVQQTEGRLNFHDALIALGCKELDFRRNSL
ncbi:MAG: hypothetical protein ABIG63_11120 [Chloroflexota bacterium]